jgi:8-oxo-dGTP pyrophosphatase MutT (NUDIX family)
MEAAAGAALSDEPEVRAAGGVVARVGDDDAEILLVHRPKYDDWSLPKGKALADESDEDCAVREVWEETGLRCEHRFELPSTRYRDRLGRDKRVRYWAMGVLEGAFEPHAEVDELAWLPPREARARLTWERDGAVVRAFGHDGSLPLLLVRHASAGNRKAWHGDDGLRPLDERGRLQAERLVEVLAGHRIARVCSSPSVRCVQTVEPFGFPVEQREELAEGAGPAALAAVAAEGPGVLCLHGDVLAELLGHEPPKGSTTLVDDGLRPVATIPPPAL